MQRKKRKKKVVVANHKGGVGKTTTAVNLAACVAEAGARPPSEVEGLLGVEMVKEGFRALLIDLDPQANASDHVGVRENKRPGVYRVIFEGESLAEAVVKTKFGFDVLSGGDNTIVIEALLSAKEELRTVLRDAIDASDLYDVVIIDVPPMITHVMKAALIAADNVVVPMNLEAMPVAGLAQLIKSIDAQLKINPQLKLAAVFDTKSDTRTLLGREVTEILEKHCGSVLTKSRIRRNTPLARAFFLKEPITHYDPKSPGAADYRALTKELFERGVL